ncbi:MAG: class I tRNA ligase family protein [Candidatus Pacebacteria bacterium]|nr:class I tRNA ligase family protein [Candidatus Paceibacterota bacterium]
MAENIEHNKSEAALREERILEFWKENKIFEKSLKQTEGEKEFIFYEGPPTANGKPGIHHLEARAFKDAIPRYKTMQGFHVRRKGGWDTHGLPVELQVEKKLGLNSKKGIEEYGIAKFNQECKESVWEYLEVWNKFTKRIGYWVDQENAYVTYHNDYIESVWNIVKKINEQKLLYKDYKVVPWCPRCGTALSSHELAQGYEEVKDLSVTAKFKVVPSAQKNPSALLHPMGGTFRLQDSSVPTYILAWTTTPWTLPGNVALAVGEKLDYVKIKVGNEFFILAKARLSVVEGEYEIIEEIKGKDLLGLEYEPLYPFLSNTVFETEKWKMEKAYKVYGAGFVTTEDGTGVVHTAVMYGQDDFVLGTKVGLPKHHLVGLDGRFLAGTGIFEGRFVRDEDVAVDVIKDLAHRGLLFKKEKYEHSYPHCWRCKTALIYYARDSWYIKVSDPLIKDKMISENKTINWEPSHIRDGRFGEWLREIKDWAVSRERYWGTPLPVWTCEDCKTVEVIGSVEEIKDKTKKSGNKYFVIRHGEAENNAKNIYSSDPNINHLTEKGKEQVLKTAKELINKKVSIVYCSPFLRTRETVEIVSEKIGFPKDKIIYDDRIRELGLGDFSGKSSEKYLDFAEGKTWTFDEKIPGGESYQDTKNRFGEFLYEIDQKHHNETILIVSHGLAVEVIPSIIEGADKKRSLEIFTAQESNKTASLHKEHNFIPIPHNENYELDLHRPYIDEVKLVCSCGGNLVRTKEVMDVWLDSGAMPFAQDHYPFENKKWVDGVGYPADFISEAIDQTRGWFYTLHAVGVLMGRGKAYKNVICLGHLLDAKGKKMSKSLGNIVDPWEAMDKYGADTLRLWMYSVNQPGESKNFDEKTVALLHQQVFGLLYNVLAFYELYRDKEAERSYLENSKRYNLENLNVLDQWILARLDELIKISTDNLDNYKLLEPTRAIRDFVGDLSTWYLRRSRDRIKDANNEDSKEAKQTLYFVLKTLVKVMAPFAPLAAEDIWLKLKNEQDVESVHLTEWPKTEKVNTQILDDMKKVREIVTLGLEARQKAGIKVRQPLNQLQIKNYELGIEYTELIKEELNVKEIKENKNIENEVLLDVKIDEELKQEGDYRELMRALQDMRKKMGLTPSDVVSVVFETDEAGKNLIEKFEADMKKTILASKIKFKESGGEEIKIDELVFKVKIEK